MDYTKAFEISDNGLQFEEAALVFSGDGLPTSYGVNFPKGSIYFRNNTPQIWHKWGTATDEWLDVKANILGLLSDTIQLQHNGTITNGVYVSYDANITNKKIIFTKDTLMHTMQWQNGRTDVDFDLVLYKNGLTEDDICNTFEIRSDPAQLGGDVGYGIKQNCDTEFLTNDWIQIKYVTQGTNAQDLIIRISGRSRDITEV